MSFFWKKPISSKAVEETGRNLSIFAVEKTAPLEETANPVIKCDISPWLQSF